MRRPALGRLRARIARLLPRFGGRRRGVGGLGPRPQRLVQLVARRGRVPHLVQRVAATFDDAIEACLRETVCSRGAPDDARWRRALKQARLPVRLGGLGLTSAEGQADAAWCGSWALCWSRMQRFFPALAAIDLTTAAPRAAAAGAAAAAPGEAAAAAPLEEAVPLEEL